MTGRSARLAIHLAPNAIGLALSHAQPAGRAVTETLLMRDADRDGNGLIAAVDELIRSSQIPPESLAGIAFAAGPGSFSRVRVACAVAQGLALSVDCQVIPISSLQAMALVAGREKIVRIAVLIDARMEAVYCAVYAVDQQDGLTTELEPALVGLDQLEAYLSKLPPSEMPLVGCGDAWQRYGLTLPSSTSLLLPEPSAEEVAAACLALSDHAPWLAPAMAAPIYLRDKVALDITEQAALRARNSRRSAQL